MTTYHSSLAEHHRVLDELSFRREIEAVVEEFRPVVSYELVTERTDFAVHDQGFGIQVCESEDGHCRGIVAAAALQSNEAVLETQVSNP